MYAANKGARSVARLLNFLDELNLKYELPVMYEDCNNGLMKERVQCVVDIFS